jgi:alkylhydroperoxidase family enzyme
VHLDPEFATTWTYYDLDAPTKALLRYASKLTETPSLVNEQDTGRLREAGWDEAAIWEITALVSFFNFSGRLEAAAGLPRDEVPEGARFAEARPG